MNEKTVFFYGTELTLDDVNEWIETLTKLKNKLENGSLIEREE